ncbi:MAG: hypothetical protein ACI8PZ_002559, partial [Myxococcota bacterium]
MSPQLDQLEGAGWVVQTHRLECPAGVRREVLATLHREGRLSALAAGIDARVSEAYPPMLAIERALAVGEEATVISRWGAMRETSRPLAMLFLEPPDLEAVIRLPHDLFDLMLREAWDRDRWDRDATTCAALFPLFKKHVQAGVASEVVRLRWVEECIWQGELLDAVTGLAGSELPRAHTCRGWISLLFGDWASSVEHFDAGAAALPSGAHDEGMDRLMHGIALLAAETDSHRRRATSLAGDDSFLRGLVAVAHGKPMPKRRPRSDRPGAGLLAEGGAAWVAGAAPSRSLAADLEQLATQARALGHTWLAEEAADLARAPDEESARTTIALPLADRIGRVAPWRATLTALGAVAGMAPSTAPAKAPVGPKERLVWTLHRRFYGDLPYVVPRLQKRNKDGWTGGRAIALERLHGRGKGMSFFTADDVRVLGALTSEVRYGGYRNRYAETVYSFDRAAAARALVGHPQVCWEDDTDGRIEVVAGKPALIVQACPGGVRVRLDPDGDVQLAARKVTEYRLEIVEMSAAHRRIAATLADGLVLPQHAVPELLAVVDRLATHVTVASDIEGLGAESASADPAVVLIARRERDGLQLRAVVRPLGSGGPELVPGEGSVAVLGTADGRAVQATRDLDAEKHVLTAALAACPTLDEVLMRGGRWRLSGPHAVAALAELAVLGGLARAAARHQPGLGLGSDGRPLRRGWAGALRA